MSTFGTALRVAAATALACSFWSLTPGAAFSAPGSGEAAAVPSAEKAPAPAVTLAQAPVPADVAQPSATARPAVSEARLKSGPAAKARGEGRRVRVVRRRAIVASSPRPNLLRVAALGRMPVSPVTPGPTPICGPGCSSPLFLGVGF